MSSVSSPHVPEWLLWFWAAHLDPTCTVQWWLNKTVCILKDDCCQTLISGISGGHWAWHLSLDIISGACGGENQTDSSKYFHIVPTV